jgi:hypothetical protein
MKRNTATTLLTALTLAFLTAGCRSTGGANNRPVVSGPPVRRVICLYDQKPWLSADSAGDRDPEGIRYRVFLDTGRKRGVARDGTFHVEMYGISRDPSGKKERKLVSDWHYPTSTFSSIRANILGEGYLLHLRWASKGIAGTDVEIVTSFEDLAGRKTHASTKRLRVPKYDDYVGSADQ